MMTISRVLLTAILVLWAFTGLCQSPSGNQERLPENRGDEIALASRLAAQSNALRDQRPSSLELSVLLAIESLKRAPLLSGDIALREALTLIRQPRYVFDLREPARAMALSGNGL